MNVSIQPQIRDNFQKSKAFSYLRMKDTINIFDTLVKLGYLPADCTVGLITMHKPNFKKLINDYCNGKCSKLTTKNGTIHAVWINYVEISCVDIEATANWEVIEFNENLA